MVLKEINYDTNLKFGKFNAFGQVSKALPRREARLSLGVRTDFNTLVEHDAESTSTAFSKVLCIIFPY